MKIKEVSQKTALSKKTIRFYETAGLLNPGKQEKNGRDYRDYSEKDLKRLLEIAALRRARFTLREIREMDEDPAALPEIFRRYRQALREEQRSLTALLAAAETIDPETLTGKDELIARLETPGGLPLPEMDLRPHFRHLDAQEDLREDLRRARLRRRQRDLDISLYTYLTEINTYKKTNPRSLDMGNETKLAVMGLLRDMKDE